jgi:hypothetical protein
MKASGHSAVQMHKRYVDSGNRLAKAFGTSERLKMATGMDTEKRELTSN